MPQHDIRHRHVLADETVVYIQVIDKEHIVTLVSPIVGEDPVYPYRGEDEGVAIDMVAEILMNDVTEGVLYA